MMGMGNDHLFMIFAVFGVHHCASTCV